MIQDIAPSRMNNRYLTVCPKADDCVLCFDRDGRILVRVEDRKIYFTTAKDVSLKKAVYLFSIDRTAYFMGCPDADCSVPGFEYSSIRELRDISRCSGPELFAVFTAFHLWNWYTDNRFCGRCGGKNEIHTAERALRCTCCGHIVYPRINPAVIIGVIRNGCLLITRYRSGYAHNALVAGFTEIGETLEQTVEREVMEETGLRVRNIRYYKSQPWGMAQDLLAGFFCEADGDEEIRMDQNELKYAEWVSRQDIILQPNSLSLTNEMMKEFREGRIG